MSAVPDPGDQEYRGLIERIPAIIYVDLADDWMTNTYISPQTEWLLGVPPQEYLADPSMWERMLHPDDRERTVATYLEKRTSGRPFSFEYRMVARDGRTVWFRDEGVLVPVDGDRPAHVQGFMLDITETKEAEAATKRWEERYGELVETAQDAVFTLNEEGRFMSLNQAFEQATGWTREEWLGRTFTQLIHPDDLPIAFRQVQHVARGEAPPPFVLRVSKRDGTFVDAEYTVTPQLASDGRVVGVLGIARDVTERARVAEELHAAKEAAEAASRAKSEFLANMSHEIRTPLNAVLGLSELLLGTELSAEQQDYVETVRASGDALLAVISDILDFSKIEAGRLDVEHAPFDIRACVEESLDLVASTAASKGLELAYLVDQYVPATLLGDASRVRQILTNLLSNAVKFTEAGEVVVTVSSRPRDDRRHDVHIAVVDTGIGIGPEAMDVLFDSFTQVDASITRKYGGTGLGLAISRRLAERMGGGMWAESTVGAGSTFHVTILAEVGPEHSLRRPTDEGLLRGLRVLVVDDNATNRLILSKQVRGWGMVPSEAGSAAEAMELLDREAAFDVAVLDMCMPGVNGEALAREMREERSGAELPLVMLTSLGRRQEDPVDSPFAAYLTKPVKPSKLYDTLADVLSWAKDRPVADAALTVTATPPVDRQAVASAGNGVPHASDETGAPEADDRLGTRHPLRILVAEDNPVNRKVALRMLERIGYGAEMTTNGVEAMSALERAVFDVVLMDVQMPEMDGLETARRIRRTFALGDRPRVIAMTAHALQGDRERCFEAGMDDYLTKPLDLHALSEALEKSAPLARSQDRERVGRPGTACLYSGARKSRAPAAIFPDRDRHPG